MNEVFRRVAAALGLQHHARAGLLCPERLDGEVAGQPVSGSLDEQGIRVEATLEPALDLGLSIAGRPFFGPSDALRPVIELGDPNWDDEVRAFADEPARARALIGPELKRAMLAVNSRNLSFHVDDARVRAYERLEEEELRATFLRVAEVGRLLNGARDTLPVPTGLRSLEPALRALCGAYALTFAATPLRARGRIGGALVDLRVERSAPSSFTLKLRGSPVEPPPELGLRVRPTRLRDRVSTLLGGQDVRVGDEAFDRAFRVEAVDEPRATAALDREARALLQELGAQADAIELTDQGLIFDSVSARVPAERLAALLLGAATLVERVARASAAELRGPYR